jgi:hypothetical protein
MKDYNNNKEYKEDDYSIKMDGEFHQFDGGAIRYTKTGKGRFDLIPEDIMCEILCESYDIVCSEEYDIYTYDDVLYYAINGEYTKAIDTIVNIHFVSDDDKEIVRSDEAGPIQYIPDNYDGFIKGFSRMLNELAIHYEKGAEKYGVDNWKKGIPYKSFRDSGLRHLIQWIKGETDEHHHIAAIWNFIGAMWVTKQEEHDTPKKSFTTTLILPYHYFFPKMSEHVNEFLENVDSILNEFTTDNDTTSENNVLPDVDTAKKYLVTLIDRSIHWLGIINNYEIMPLLGYDYHIYNLPFNSDEETSFVDFMTMIESRWYDDYYLKLNGHESNYRKYVPGIAELICCRILGFDVKLIDDGDDDEFTGYKTTDKDSE